MYRNEFLLWLTIVTTFSILAIGCWTETVTNKYDCAPNTPTDTPGQSDCDSDCDTDTDSDTDAYTDVDIDADTDADSDSDSDTDTDADTNQGQGIRPEGWEDMGKACEVHEDCANIPGGLGRCVFDVVEFINLEGGYCAACCNKPALDGCAPGIDCVGADEVYLVCINHCTDNSQCRTDENYECRPLWYLDSIYPGDYCLPDADHVEPPEGSVPTDPECDWPWL
jgi:hypothetical protein